AGPALRRGIELVRAGEDEQAAGAFGAAQIGDGDFDQAGERPARVGVGEGRVGGGEAGLGVAGEDLFVEAGFGTEGGVEAAGPDADGSHQSVDARAGETARAKDGLGPVEGRVEIETARPALADSAAPRTACSSSR